MAGRRWPALNVPDLLNPRKTLPDSRQSEKTHDVAVGGGGIITVG